MQAQAIYTNELPECRDCGGEGGGTVFLTTTAPVTQQPESWERCSTCNPPNRFDHDSPHAGKQYCDGCGVWCEPRRGWVDDLIGPGQVVYVIGDRVAHSFECALELMAMAEPVAEREAA